MAEIQHMELPRGSSFIDFALGETLKHVQAGRKDEQLVTWARQTMAAAGGPKSMLGRAEAIYKAFCERVSYTEDPFDVEFIAKPRDVMCLPGADFCMRAADCEEHAAALCACFGAVGLQTALVHQRFPGSNHAIAAVYTEDGWKRADSSYYSELGKKLGAHYPATQERWFDTLTGTVMHTGPGSTVPSGVIGGAMLVSKKPMHEFVSISGIDNLGAADDPAQRAVAAWGTWLAAANGGMKSAFLAARDAADALAATRQALGLPQYDAAGSAGWTEQVAKAFYGDVATAVTNLASYADQALAGGRGVSWNNGALAIAAQPADKYAYSVSEAGILTVKQIQGPAPQPGLGGPELLVVAGVVALSVESVVAYLVVAQLCDTYRAHIAAAAQRDLATTTNMALKQGATAEQAAALAKAIGKAAPTAGVPPPKSDPLVDLFGKLVTGVLIIAAAGAVVYVGERVLEAHAAKKAA